MQPLLQEFDLANMLVICETDIGHIEAPDYHSCIAIDGQPLGRSYYTHLYPV